MIGILFQFAGETIEVRIDGSNVFFRTSQFQQFGDIDGMRMDKAGVIKEFPDLKDNKDWQNIARQRFKDKMKQIDTEMGRARYIISDLTKFGYKPLFMQKKGFRPIKL